MSKPFLSGEPSVRRTPGLYLDWLSGAARAPRVESGVPIFVGLTGRANARPDAPALYRFSRWQQFDQAFPEEGVSALLACSVRGFFENGGRLCYVLPIGLDPDPDRVTAGNADPGSAQADPAHAAALAQAIRTAFRPCGPLDDCEDADLVCVPDIMTRAIARSPERVFDLQSVVVDYCSRMGERFAILDTYSGNPEHVTRDRDDAALFDALNQWQALPANHGALYYPWVLVAAHRRRLGGRSTVLVPPCGHVAGIYARSDRRDGVHKPPANEVLEGVLDLGRDVDDDDQAILNDAGVNCLRVLRGWDIRVWGARTLSDRPAWRYVNVTRVLLALTRWLETGMHDLVFEPNDVALWALIEQRLAHYCGELFRRGALQGARADQAYFVQCDAHTNAQTSRDSGVVVAQVGLAPASPSEFVIVRITHSASGVNLTVPTAWQ